VANHKSAEKRARQAKHRTLRNHGVKSRTRTLVKNFRAAITGGDLAESEATLNNAEITLRKAASKGILPKRRVSRQISRLAKQRNKLRDA